MNFQYSEEVMVIAGITAFAGIIYILLNQKKFETYQKISPLFILLGILFPFFAAFFNSYIENRWDIEYIFSFLTFKTSSGKWGFSLHHICMWGYVIFPWGVVMLLVARLKKFK